jgi:hypothetical protein
MSVQIYCKHFSRATKNYFVMLLLGSGPALDRKDKTGSVLKMVQALFDPTLKNRSFIMGIIQSQKNIW